MPVAAYPTTVKVAGTAVAFTDEATTKVTANTVYQITDTSKRVLDPSANVVVEVDPDGVSGFSAADADDYTVDYLFGRITFASDQGANAVVRVDGSYLPLVSVVGATEFQLQMIRTLLPATRLGQADAWRRRIAGLKDASGSISNNEPLHSDLDGGAGTRTLEAVIEAGTPVLLEIHPAATGNYWRGWVLLETAEEGASIDELLEGSINWQAAPVKGANQAEAALIGWGT